MNLFKKHGTSKENGRARGPHDSDGPAEPNLHRIHTHPTGAAEPTSGAAAAAPLHSLASRAGPARRQLSRSTQWWAHLQLGRRPDVDRPFVALPPSCRPRPAREVINPRRPTCGVRMQRCGVCPGLGARVGVRVDSGVAFARAPWLPRRLWINTPGGAGDSAARAGKERRIS